MAFRFVTLFFQFILSGAAGVRITQQVSFQNLVRGCVRKIHFNFPRIFLQLLVTLSCQDETVARWRRMKSLIYNWPASSFGNFWIVDTHVSKALFCLYESVPGIPWKSLTSALSWNAVMFSIPLGCSILVSYHHSCRSCWHHDYYVRYLGI